MPGRVVVPKVFEFTEHPWGRGNLEVNGIQYHGVANTNVETLTNVNTMSFNTIGIPYPGSMGKLKEVSLGFTVEFKTPDNGDAVVSWKIMGRNAAGASNEAPFDANTVGWVDLCATQTQTKPVNAAWQPNSLSGYPKTQANFNAIPFELQLAFTSNCSKTQARIKNSSYVKYLYEIA